MELNEMLSGAQALAGIDTNAAIFRCRQFAESLTKALAEANQVDISGTPLVEQINAVASQAGLQPRTVRALHNLRILGNQAVHHHLSGAEQAEAALALCEEILAATRGLLPPGVWVEIEMISPREAAEAAPEAEAEAEANPGPLVNAVRTLMDQAMKHLFAGVDVPALASFEQIDPSILLQLTTSGVPRQILEEEGQVACQEPGQPLDLKKIGALSKVGFRLVGIDLDVVKLIVPPTSRPDADLGLSPLGDVYLDALCNAVYLEGRLARTDIRKHLIAALTSARTARSMNPAWPNSIPYPDMRNATLSAFQWPHGTFKFLIAPKGHRTTPWKDISGSTSGWMADSKAGRIWGL